MDRPNEMGFNPSPLFRLTRGFSRTRVQPVPDRGFDRCPMSTRSSSGTRASISTQLTPTHFSTSSSPTRGGSIPKCNSARSGSPFDLEKRCRQPSF
ncbi:hypothetical protein V6N13_148348 [Hibiscus sabdariffa]